MIEADSASKWKGQNAGHIATSGVLTCLLVFPLPDAEENRYLPDQTVGHAKWTNAVVQTGFGVRRYLLAHVYQSGRHYATIIDAIAATLTMFHYYMNHRIGRWVWGISETIGGR